MRPEAHRLLLLITRLLVNGLALLVVDAVFRGIWLETWQTTVAAAVALALINAYLRPLVIVLTLPINVLTLGLFTIIINALMLWLVHWLIPSFHITSFWHAVGGALVISLVSFLLNWFLDPGRIRVHVRR